MSDEPMFELEFGVSPERYRITAKEAMRYPTYDSRRRPSIAEFLRDMPPGGSFFLMFREPSSDGKARQREYTRIHHHFECAALSVNIRLLYRRTGQGVRIWRYGFRRGNERRI